ncbi:DNA recombination protein RmuC [Pontibacter sp. HSC-14F20]|uniref:DNA recombination protein RmuC n=1 Tax=Pontibacter sp. HSC-14F20 TaxID=2864136 RepID=UPI001C72B0EE|nr:DNA recombination protein RmuC [Pontibacter sp. HSC-14F20]MBX0332972.1 DNA recombination protein RmuC [Pontibacter sp. HSC-14F20]
MDLLSIFLGFLFGSILSFIIANLLTKTKHVSKADYDALHANFNEVNTKLKVAEDRASGQQQELTKLNLKLESKESEFNELQSTAASLKTVVTNNEQKISELATSLTEQTNLVSKQQQEINVLNQRCAQESASNRSLVENIEQQKILLKGKDEHIAEITERNNQLIAANSTLTANNSSLNEKITTQKDEITKIQETALLQFEKIANQILEEKSGKFTDVNKANIEALLKPLGDNIDTFKKKVEETYDKESKERFSLEAKVKELVEQTNKVSTEANNLATALKGQSKKQGDWGEMILESILQQSGLEKEREYFLQQTIKDEEGNSLRPDVLVKLPDERVIIIDSKVSLVSYDRYFSAETAEAQEMHLHEHLKSIRKHIDDLQGKKYDNLESSLDFTMMFVPIEPAYMIAIQNDRELWSYAYSKRILLISPTNLIACLKLMADLWKREMQSKNAMEIVNRGEKLYEKFVGFVSKLEDVGKHLEKSRDAYDHAIGQLKTGSGNLIGQAIKLKDLGLKSSKTISAAMLPTEDEPEQVIIDPILLNDGNDVEPLMAN